MDTGTDMGTTTFTVRSFIKNLDDFMHMQQTKYAGNIAVEA
jgi:hypothetical protein